MVDVLIRKCDESYIQIDCEKGIAQEIYTHFQFYVPGYKFSPKYRNKIWDGKIRLFDIKNYRIYLGLIEQVKQFCVDNNYKFEVLDGLDDKVNFTVDDAKKFIESLKIPFEVRDYQIKSFVESIRNKRILILSPTGSGKSLIIYLIIRYLQKYKQNGLLIVPNISLVTQMYKDFENYGYDSLEHCHMIYSGKEKISDKFLYISTWQSLQNLKPSFFKRFDFVIGDESHKFKAKQTTEIMLNCVNCDYKIGTTGTLDGTQTNKLVLEGLFGPVYKTISTNELIENKQLSKFRIKCLIIKYDQEESKKIEKSDYNVEIDFLIKHEKRNKFIKKIALDIDGNTLILFRMIDHGKKLYDLISEECGERKVFLIYGETDVKIREEVRSIVEKTNDSIIIASYGTFSTGINIRNLHNVVFASPSKSRVLNLQSIGRVLRLGENKEEAILYDIADDLRVDKYVNHTLKHFLERVKYYDEEKFEYKFIKIPF